MLLQTQDQTEKLYNVLGSGGGQFKNCITAGNYFHYSDFKVKLEVAGDHRSIAN